MLLHNIMFLRNMARTRNLVAGLDRFNFMPYKDHETDLRKQREFYYRRKTRAKGSPPFSP